MLIGSSTPLLYDACMRVISLLPSATELVYLVAGDDADALLVGRSHECDYPLNPHLASLPVLTGQTTSFTTSADVDAAVRAQLQAGTSLYTLDTDLLVSLEPDVIITQDLCEVCSIDLNTVRAAVASMPSAKQPDIVSLNPESLENVFDDVLRIGQVLKRSEDSRAALVLLRERFHAAADYVNPYTDGPSVAFLEWTDPLFIGGHWTPQLIERAGGKHPLNPTAPLPGSGTGAGAQGAHTKAGKSFRITREQLIESRPDIVIVCPCGLSLSQAVEETQLLAQNNWWNTLPAVRNDNVYCVDGNHMFNRPGPRLVDAFEFLVATINNLPDVMASNFLYQKF